MSNSYRAAVTADKITIRPLGGRTRPGTTVTPGQLDAAAARKVAIQHLQDFYPGVSADFKLGRARASKTIPGGTEFPLTPVS